MLSFSTTILLLLPLLLFFFIILLLLRHLLLLLLIGLCPLLGSRSLVRVTPMFSFLSIFWWSSNKPRSVMVLSRYLTDFTNLSSVIFYISSLLTTFVSNLHPQLHRYALFRHLSSSRTRYIRPVTDTFISADLIRTLC